MAALLDRVNYFAEYNRVAKRCQTFVSERCASLDSSRLR
jgi:hypothetical protein